MDFTETPKNYILFIGQESNFGSRSMLIPAKEFLGLETRKKDYETLKKYSKKVKFITNSKEYIVDNTLILNIKWEKKENNTSIGSFDKTEYSKICHELIQYANCWEKNIYSKIEDKIWVDGAILDICDSFDNIQDYIKCRQMNEYNNKKINIIDSFLVLESDDGKLRQFNSTDYTFL